MITVDGIQYRNLEEQVRKNQDDIKFILEEKGVLNEFGIKVVAQVSDASALPDPATYGGEYGDAYAVGTASPYTFYIFTRANGGVGNDYWFNVGVFPAPGPAGPQGPIGDKGERGLRGSTWTTGKGEPSGGGYHILDQYLNTSNGNVYTYMGGKWQLAGNIRGPQGIQGLQGATGPQGPQGNPGLQGEKGDPGPAFVIEGVVADVSLLPDPATLPDNVAYLVGAEATGYDLYVQLQGSNQWFNVGSIEMVSGPKGDPGPTGPQGPQGPAGVAGHSVYTSTDSYAADVGGHGAIWQDSTDAKGVGDVVITSNGKVGTIVGEAMIEGRKTWYILNTADIRGPAGIDKPYELIETITLTEDVAQISRTSEPDGKAYNFKKLFIDYQGTKSMSRVRAQGHCKYGNNTFNYNCYIVTSQTMGYIEVDASDILKYYGAGGGAAGYTTQWCTTGNAAQIQKVDSITSLIIEGTDSLYAGTVIRIYGVRA